MLNGVLYLALRETHSLNLFTCRRYALRAPQRPVEPPIGRYAFICYPDSLTAAIGYLLLAAVGTPLVGAGV